MTVLLKKICIHCIYFSSAFILILHSAHIQAEEITPKNFNFEPGIGYEDISYSEDKRSEATFAPGDTFIAQETKLV